jgi:hypothetical protein
MSTLLYLLEQKHNISNVRTIQNLKQITLTLGFFLNQSTQSIIFVF